MDGFAARRRMMVARLMHMGIRHPEVLEAMGRVPRHVFVEEALRSRAYDDMALPLGFGQTISQPYTVARMSELLLGDRHPESDARPLRRILEIGTGCGYQTAVLLALRLPEVYSIERLAGLYERAKVHLRAARLTRARLICGDGYVGLSQMAPFDGIIVTAAPKHVPVALLQQLSIGGRMVIPLDDGHAQYLWLIEKTATGYHESCIQEANFVPLLSGSA